jgi:hypothetical protein
MKDKRKEASAKGGKNRWAKISKKKRSEEMRLRANQLWAKIRAGKLAQKETNLTK